MSKCLSDYHVVQVNTQGGLVNWYHHVLSINQSAFHIAFTMVVRGHYSDVITSTMASQIPSLTIVYSTVYWDADQRKRKYQSSASLAFVRGIHRWSVNSPAQRASNAENVSIWWRHHGQLEGVPDWNQVISVPWLTGFTVCFWQL